MEWLSCVRVAGQGSHQWCVAVTAGGGTGKRKGGREDGGKEGGRMK